MRTHCQGGLLAASRRAETSFNNCSSCSPAVARSGALLSLQLAIARSPLDWVILEAIADDRVLRCAHLVEAAHGAVVRRLVQQLRALGCLTRDRKHRLDELVERLLRLRF